MNSHDLVDLLNTGILSRFIHAVTLNFVTLLDTTKFEMNIYIFHNT
jgi:hypothetical protein